MNPLGRSVALLFVLFAAMVALGVLGLSVPVASAGVGGGAFQQNASTGVNTTNASITFENQTRTGRSVYVRSATLPAGGFVVLEEPGRNGSVVGVSLPLDPGTHEGKITLRGVPGADANLTRLGANTTLVATLHRDSDGDGRFEGLLAPDTDEPYTANATPVSDRARVTIPDAERPPKASVTLTNETSRGTTITVESVTLAEGGYVGIHRGGDSRSNATATMVGATGYLEAGSYENLTVAVGAGNNSALTDSGRVSAVVYADTDGDRRFQYVPSGGVEDQPALANGTPVAASAFVTVERPETPTPRPTSAETSTQTPTATADSQRARDRATPYGGENNGREGILDNPLFPVLVVVFAVFAVLAAVGR